MSSARRLLMMTMTSSSTAVNFKPRPPLFVVLPARNVSAVPPPTCPGAQAMERAREELRKIMELAPMYERLKGHIKEASQQGSQATDIALKKLAKAKNFPEDSLNDDEKKCSFARFLGEKFGNEKIECLFRATDNELERYFYDCEMDISGIGKVLEKVDELCKLLAKLETTCSEEELKPWFDQNPPPKKKND